MRLIKIPIINNFSPEILESIKEEINSRPKTKNLGVFGTLKKNSKILDFSFRYSNPIIEEKNLYLDIETIHTPEGVEFRKMIEMEKNLDFFISLNFSKSESILVFSMLSD
jgi:hypothetical protein